MLALKSIVLSTLLLLSTQVLAVPSPQTSPAANTSSDYVPVLRCGVDGPDGTPLRCPPKYTCCGPLTQEGGTCRLLKPGQACLF